ncbi:Hypothetical predicted protein, partial [Olea europaea subsp. europaea]
PRCSAADGSSCTCSEDETCISRPLRTNVQHLQASSALVTKTSLEVDSRISTDAGKVANSMMGSSPPQVVRVSHLLDRGNCFNYADGVDAKEMMHLSPPITDQIVKAGFVAVGVLSDLVNNKIPVLDGMLNTPPNSLVERSKPISNIRSVNVKTSRKDRIHGKSSAESSESKFNNVSYGTKGRADKLDTDKAVKNVPSNGSGNFVDSHGISLEAREGNRSIPQRSRVYPNCFVADIQHLERKCNSSMIEGFARPIRET